MKNGKKQKRNYWLTKAWRRSQVCRSFFYASKKPVKGWECDMHKKMNAPEGQLCGGDCESFAGILIPQSCT
jgi:hypothetical protein